MLIATLTQTGTLMNNYLNLLLLRFFIVFNCVSDVNKEKIAFRHSFWPRLVIIIIFLLILPWCNVKSKFLNIIQSFESGYLFSTIFRVFFFFFLYLHDISTAHVPLLVPLINSGLWIHAKQKCTRYGRWITKGTQYHAHLIDNSSPQDQLFFAT